MFVYRTNQRLSKTKCELVVSSGVQEECARAGLQPEPWALQAAESAGWLLKVEAGKSFRGALQQAREEVPRFHHRQKNPEFPRESGKERRKVERRLGGRSTSSTKVNQRMSLSRSQERMCHTPVAKRT